MKRVIQLIVLAGIAAGAWALLRPAALHPGEASLDLSVYADSSRDARPVAEVVRPAAQAPARRPNFVVILADDLGWGDVGANGNRVIRTPSLDSMAERGARFTHFYASGVYCSPSRAGLLSGRYPIRSGITFPIQPSDDRIARRFLRIAGRLTARMGATDLAQAGESAIAGLPGSEITLAEALKQAGYATGMVGKWHLGDFTPEDLRFHPMRHGFDTFAGYPHSNDEFPYSYWEDERVVDPNVGLAQEGETGRLTEQAIRFIDAHRDAPFFLYLAHKNVHTPLYPAAAFAGRSAAGAYGDSVEELDASVGEIVRALETRGLLENTVVVFSSDNGPWHQGSAGGLRGRKGQPMEGGQRVPTFVLAPGLVPAGRVIDAPSMNIDLFPTLLGLAGLTEPSDRVIDGRNIRALLAGETDATPHDGLYFFNANQIDGVRAGRWKYYRHVNEYVWPVPLDKPNTWAGQLTIGERYEDPESGRSSPLLTKFPLLYDVVADRDESYDLSASQPDEAKRLHGLIEGWEQAFRTNPRGWR